MVAVRPHRDGHGNPSVYHAAISEAMGVSTVMDCFTLEHCLLVAAKMGGSCRQQSMRFKAALHSSQLRLQRKTCQDMLQRKRLSFEIRPRQRREVRQRKSQMFARTLGAPKLWRRFHDVKALFRREATLHPQHEEFASLLDDLFAVPSQPRAPLCFGGAGKKPLAA